MKHIIFINGTMGVGKTATCQELKHLLPCCVFLDGDWCWDMSPFIVNEETKTMVMQNIVFLLNQFLVCSQFTYVVFCWVMPDIEILDSIRKQLKGKFNLHLFSLVCSPNILVQRLKTDISNGKRNGDIVERSLSYLPLYANMPTVPIDVSHCSPKEAAEQIVSLL